MSAEAAELLERGAKRIECYGWGRGQFVDGWGRCCAIGAIQAGTPGCVGRVEYVEAKRALAAAVGGTYASVDARIFDWNDNQCPSGEACVAVLREVAARLREEARDGEVHT